MRLGRLPVIGSCVIWLACGGGPASGPAACPAGPPAAAFARLPSPPTLAAGDPIRGGILFGEQCTRCHSEDVAQRGSRFFRGYPRLDCADWVSGVSDGYLYTVIAQGGVSVGKPEVMTGFDEFLSPLQISDLVAYLRSFDSP